jgi:beta-phosphoglucomutase-like phosphatase (HAD superfamily)
MIPIAPDVKALIFDLDGTLADTMPLHYKAWHETFAASGVVCPQSFLESRNGIPTEIIVSQFNDAFGHNLDPVEFAHAKEARVVDGLLSVQPVAPVAELVDFYQGQLPMAVATGGRGVHANLILQALKLQNAFAAIITADDPVRPKPSPDIFLEAAQRLGVEPRYCQVFEDADPGLEAACKAGMVATDIRSYL